MDVLRKKYQEIEVSLRNPGSSPYPALGSSILCLGTCIKGLQGKPGYPPYIGLVAFSAIFGGSSWIITQDTEHGSSIATSWGIAFSVLFAKNAFKSLKPGPIFLTSWIIGSTGCYASEMWENLVA
ncbi:hypothetical protein HK099_005863 [Clydaea vesicula]|uniref:Uncharacterized protein n=1 Tax=Clydaea vesicula TaxID=447962 RepID=A0AAD5TY81_9FUNG|nr:hypothetical protein HK099_005863 [Clydaea vesicula]KAJ3383528.1 hypothetical protein HDU92_004078 [Lobulomyces angularis]